MTSTEIFDRILELSKQQGLHDAPRLEADESLQDVAVQKDGSICIKESQYQTLSDAEKCVIMAHEWAHFAENQIRVRFFSRIQISSEMIADWYVARIGFSSELKKARSYGTEYNGIVDSFGEPREYAKRINVWEMRHLAGLTET